jgi:kumamolisin
MAALTGYKQLENSLRPSRRGARMIGPTDAKEDVLITIVVRRKRGAPALPDHQYWMSVPPGRRRFPSRQEFASKHGAAPDDLEVVAEFCRSLGFAVVDCSIARRCVVASGNAEVMAKAFQVELSRYATANETYRGYEGYVQLPAEIADIVQGVLGLDNRRLGRHASNGAPIGAQSLTPIQVAQLYNFPLPGSGNKDATGQTIGILEFAGGGYSPADFNSYWTSIGIPTANQAKVSSVPANQPPAGSKAFPSPSDIEVALDVEVAGAIAQGAQIVIYFANGISQGAPDEQAWYNLISTALMDATNNPMVLSISWGFPEPSWPPGAIDLIKTLFSEEAANLGVTVFAASGDYGASGYNPNDPNFQPGLFVEYPASDPYVTGCGGTVIVTSPSYQQSTWNDPSGATGGGISAHFAAVPPWQSEVTVTLPNESVAQPLPGRGVPDVAGNASRFSGYDIVVYLTPISQLTLPGGQQVSAVAGTSAVAPLYAGLLALINANLFPFLHTLEITSQTSVGFLNPTLYAVSDPGVVFQDIADGGNNNFNNQAGYTSVLGWDPCTGWGSIQGTQLLEVLALTYVSENPGCMAIIQKIAAAWRSMGV